MENNITLYRISLLLTKKGFEWSKVEFHGRKTDSGFVVDKDVYSTFTGKTKRVASSKLLIPDSKTFDTHKFIAYNIWCLPEDEEKAKSILKAKVVSVATEIRDEAMKMFVHLENYEKLINQ